MSMVRRGRDANSAHVERSITAALALGQVLVSLDGSVVTVALPRMKDALAATSAELQLIVVAYMIALAALTLPIAALSDRIGRRRIYLVGAAIFAAGSLLCGVAWDASLLIVSRAVQGVGAACMMGLAMPILTESVDRSKLPGLVALWSTISVGAGTAGPVFGGVIVQMLNWRDVFFINVPLSIAVLTLAWRWLTDDRRADGSVEGMGAGLLLGTLLATLVVGLTASERVPWTSALVLAPIGVSLVLLLLFVFQQRHTDTPMINWALILRSPLPLVMLLQLLLSFALAGSLYQVSLFGQNVLLFGPAEAGSMTLAASIAMALITPFAGRLQTRLGSSLPLFSGAIVAVAGLLVLGRLDRGSTAFTIVVGLGILAMGLAIANPILQSVAMQASSEESAGAISGSMGFVGQVAGILGVTLFSSLATRLAVDHWLLAGGAPDASPMVGIGDVAAVFTRFGIAAGNAAGDAYAVGLHAAFAVAGGLVALAAVVALLLPRSRVSEGASMARTTSEPA